MDVLEQQSDARHAGLTEVFRSEGLEIKRDFWAKNQLLALDLCVFGALRQIKAEPVITKMEDGGELVVDFYYGAEISTTADNSGVLLLIVIPTNYYPSVDINWIQVEEWTEHFNPTQFQLFNTAGPPWYFHGGPVFDSSKLTPAYTGGKKAAYPEE